MDRNVAEVIGAASNVSVKVFVMVSVNDSPASRRARRPDSLADAVVHLIAAFAVPLPTHAVRTLLSSRGRAVTAQNLNRLAAYEHRDASRTRLPPRLCSVIAPSGEALKPRWWALGTWPVRRRIATDDAVPIWVAASAAELCFQLGTHGGPTADAVRTLALSMVARSIPLQHFDVPLDPASWMDLRRRVLETVPAATRSLDAPTTQQQVAEDRLKVSALTPVDLYFGVRHE